MYITIPFVAHGVNMLPNPYVVGMPSLTGIDGLVHQLERLIQQQNPNLISGLFSWSLCMQKCEVLPGHPRIVNYEHSKRSKRDTPPTTLDERKGIVEGTLFICADMLENASSVMLGLLVEKISQTLRFCGGVLRLAGSIQLFENISDALRSLPPRPGFFVEDAHHLLNDHEGESRLENMIELLARTNHYKLKEERQKAEVAQLRADRALKNTIDKQLKKKGTFLADLIENPDGLENPYTTLSMDVLEFIIIRIREKIFIGELENGEYHLSQAKAAKQLLINELEQQRRIDEAEANKPYLGYLSPAHIGFALLEAPREKRNARHGYEHAYAEPVLGLVRLRSKESVILNIKNEDNAPKVFWERIIERNSHNVVTEFNLKGY